MDEEQPNFKVTDRRLFNSDGSPRDLPALRDPDRFDAWFRRLTVNACMDVARRRSRRPIEVELTPIEPGLVGDSAANVADRDVLERAFRRLPPDQRVAVVLRYYLQMSVPEIAETVGVPIGTAQSRLHRGLAALRTVIAPADLEADRVAGGQPA